MQRTVRIVLGVGVALLALGGLRAADEPALKVGDKAPVFKATDDTGKEWNSADVVGKKVVVVYFYPADFTGGCTAQACGFRDDAKALENKGVVVVGVSGDSAKTHALFKKEHKLPFTLLADENGDLAKKFGVPVKDGGEITVKIGGENTVIKRGSTIMRWTFVIDKEGKIALVNSKVNAGKDSKAILDLVGKLK